MSIQKLFGCLMALLVLVAAGATAGPASAGEVVLAQDGKARAVIIVDASVMAADQRVPADQKDAETQRQTLRESVNDLATYLGKISGGSFEIITQTNDKTGKADKSGKTDKSAAPVSIYVGQTAQAIFGNAKPGHYKQGLRLVVKGNQVGLIGESDESTSYAVYELLGRLGCRWYMPSEMGEYVPKSKTIKLQEMDFNTEPYTYFRTLWYADKDYLRRNRCGGMRLETNQTLESYVYNGRDTKAMLEKHPEWIATIDGKPRPGRLKWSAPGLADYIASVIIERNRKTPRPTWTLSPLDGVGFDNSPEDRAHDAGDYDPGFDGISLTDRLVWFVNQIAQKVNKVYPDVRFGLLAYVNYTRPPIREKLNPNIIPQIAPITYRRAHPTDDMRVPGNQELMNIITGWNKQSPVMSYYYYGWFLAEPSAPSPFLTKWGHDVPLALSHGGRFWQPETIPNFETTMHALYMSLRLAWDPSQKPQDIYDEINHNFYGAAGDQMAAYWEFIDHCWVDTPEYSGAGFAYNRRWTPERMAKARQLMNAASIVCKTPMELKRVRLADDSLQQFERFMQIRWDFAKGDWKYLADDAQLWCLEATALGRQYSPQYAFTRAGWTKAGSVNREYYEIFYKHTYDDAARILKEDVVLTKTPINEWKYEVDKEKAGEADGYAKIDFDDKAWKTTDLNTEVWSSIGLHNYFGTVWYRQNIPAVRVPKGKKVYLWIGSTDGSVKVFVNGKHVPFVDDKGKANDVFNSYCMPASFDITQEIQSGKPIQVSIEATRTSFNELGTGGLLSPLVIYRQK